MMISIGSRLDSKPLWPTPAEPASAEDVPIEIRPVSPAMMISIGSVSIRALAADAG
jgi:hypothetical protein